MPVYSAFCRGWRPWWLIRVLCDKVEFEACQVAGSLPVQRRAGPVGLQAEQVEGGRHVHVVEAVLARPRYRARRAPWLGKRRQLR